MGSRRNGGWSMSERRIGEGIKYSTTTPASTQLFGCQKGRRRVLDRTIQSGLNVCKVSVLPSANHTLDDRVQTQKHTCTIS